MRTRRASAGQVDATPAVHRYVVNCSGGLTSAEALRRAVERHGAENTIALFADTRIEDEDLYRFLDDQERAFGVQIIRIADGRTPFQVWRDERAITIRQMAPCSKVLKRQLLDRWIAEHLQPGAYTRVFGMDWSEMHRVERLRASLSPAPTWFPLLDPPLVDKCLIAADFERLGVKPPRLYTLGFAHNNCGGGCVRAGQAHWAHLHHTMPERYARWEQEESDTGAYLGKPVTILKERKGGRARPLPLAQFRQRLEAGKPYDTSDWGGCGCFAPIAQLRMDDLVRQAGGGGARGPTPTVRLSPRRRRPSMIAVREADNPITAALAPEALPAVRLFVGGYGTYVGGQRFLLDGDREFSAAHRAKCDVIDPQAVSALLDSGAFSDPPERRLTPAGALARQLAWEAHAAKKWGARAWHSDYLVTYDRLIDETWTAGTRRKQRWTVAAAEAAVEETVGAAAYLASQRASLAPRTLILSAQGVDAEQYRDCVRAILAYATPADWIGLGGWCILGRWRSWLPAFWAMLRLVLPEITASGITHVHIFGVLYQPALGGLLWLADQHGLAVSTDSSAPVLSAAYTRPEKQRKAGVRAAGWQANTQWWQTTLANLRASVYYREPPRSPAVRQLWLMEAD